MDIYAPQTEIKSPWKEYFIIIFGFWLAGLGVLVWWADFILFNIKPDEWTSEEKQESLERLIEKAERLEVKVLSPEEKLKLMRGEPTL